MNLTLHLVRNDLRRMRPWLGGWIGVFLIPLLIGAWFLARNPFSYDAAMLRRLPDVCVMWVWVQAVVGYILTIVLFQEHPIVGTNQFWLTRPISRGRMLAAKALGTFLIVGLIPVVVCLPWWLWCGLGAGQIANAAFETILVLMVVAVPGAVMAVLTDSFPRALLWSVLLYAALMFLAFFFTVLNVATANSEARMALAVSRGVLAIAVVALEMIAIVILQFHVRRRGWWLAPAGAFIFLSVVAASQWSHPWSPTTPSEMHAERAATISLRWAGASTSMKDQAGNNLSATKARRKVAEWVNARFDVSGIPAGTIITGVNAVEKWRWPDGIGIEREVWPHLGTDPFAALGLRRPPTDPETRRWMEQNPRPRYLLEKEWPPGELSFELGASVPPSFVQRMRQAPPAFDARTVWDLWRPTLQYEVPLEASGWRRWDGRGFRIETVRQFPAQTAFTVVETQPVLIRTLLNAVTTLPHVNPYLPFGELSFIGIDRSRGQAQQLYEESGSTSRGIVVAGVAILWRSLTYQEPRVIRDGNLIQPAGSWQSARLGVLVGKVEAVFTRELKVERFELGK